MDRPANRLRSQSLAEIHSSVGTTHPSVWRRLLAFAGPAYLVSVGYMDPGNWATDLDGGARFGYRLLWVLVMSNGMAILLQTLSARLGVAAGRDLAQICRESYPRPVSMALWALCEIAIAACDLAEVLGAAIGLNLLFDLPLLWGVLLTAADTLVLLGLQQYRIRTLEVIVVRLIVIIAVCLGVDVLLAKPDVVGVVSGLVPRLSHDSLFDIIAILGATVMPHNLYLHSGLVQSRRIGSSIAAKRRACRYNLLDTMLALNGAMLVNIAILVLAAAVFFNRGIVVTEIQESTRLLEPMLGAKAASLIFAIALLCAGQASTITGTMAGQIVMEGFLNFRMRAWLRRLMTRVLAIIPAAIVVYVTRDRGAYQLLLLSQAILSLQLPFAVIPLIRFTSDRGRMGEFASGRWLRASAWLVAGVNILLNLWLAQQKATEWLALEGFYRNAVLFVFFFGAAALSVLLLYVTLAPLRTPASAAQSGGETAPEGVVFLDRVDLEEGERVLGPIDGFMSNLQGLAFIKDPAGRYVYVSGACAALWGVAPEDILSRRDDEIWPSELSNVRSRDDDAVYRDLRGIESVEIVPQDGQPRSWHFYKFPIVERSTQSVFLGGVGVDITNRQRSEEQLRGLVSRLQIAREKERAVTSHDVHHIGQLLTALDLRLSAIAERLSKGADPAAMAGRLLAASDVLASTIATSARISTGLRPSTLDNMGIADALTWHAQEFALRHRIRVIAEPLERIPLTPELGTVVFRLFQDVMANIQQHAQATEVRVSMRAESGRLALRVRDNGRGITRVELDDPHSLGLLEMRELARAFGGNIEFSGDAEAGTTITIDIPLPSFSDKPSEAGFLV